MTKVENKLISARNELYKTKTRAPRASLWMEFFMSKASKIEHEAFISAWLSIFVFPHKSLLIKSSLFPIAVHLARGKPIALAPSVLACLYKDLRLFKETIVGLTKTTTEGAKFPLKVEVNVQSPIYLVKVWLWERFKNLQLSREWIKMFQLVFTADPYFDAGVTTRYATWWKRSAGSSTCTAHAEIPLEFLHPKLVTFGKPCDYSSKAKGDDIVDGDVEDGLNSEKNSVDIVTGSDNSVEDGLNAEKNMAVDGPSPLLSVAEDGNHVQSKDGDESMEARLSNDDICQAETPTERYSFLSEESIAELEQRINQLEIVHTKLKTKRRRLLP
ncbi:putative aminotransferase-like, plant mobile domain-containing protein [Medicago truncatula]|uniref:Putative aminotransferase-like, plant mobile domain-containing protein n=1 Tax=Medicago truncatula TaxID=3880 RepID=A0A396GMG9_MEDTR|nr:putative aminotransferase-like, plant mobile domain-containing protein [Medicago truncatula]